MTKELQDEEKYKAAMPPGMKEELEARLKQQALADNDPVCPDCKSRMVLRIAQSGATPGAKFWGCTSYPKCRKTLEFKP